MFASLTPTIGFLLVILSQCVIDSTDIAPRPSFVLPFPPSLSLSFSPRSLSVVGAAAYLYICSLQQTATGYFWGCTSGVEGPWFLGGQIDGSARQQEVSFNLAAVLKCSRFNRTSVSSGYFGLECHCLDVFLGSHDFFSSFFFAYILHMDTYTGLPTNLAET